MNSSYTLRFVEKIELNALKRFMKLKGVSEISISMKGRKFNVILDKDLVHVRYTENEEDDGNELDIASLFEEIGADVRLVVVQKESKRTEVKTRFDILGSRTILSEMMRGSKTTKSRTNLSKNSDSEEDSRELSFTFRSNNKNDDEGKEKNLPSKPRRMVDRRQLMLPRIEELNKTDLQYLKVKHDVFFPSEDK